MLSDFYKSREWVDLMKVLKLERMNANGEIICEHCGKPIVHKYDCIGHHIQELTEQNYKCAEISLNPKNIALLHHRCHNKIHDKLGLSYTKQVFLVYGSPLSGKHDWVKDNMNAGDIIVDIDSIWECISGCDKHIKPNRLKQNVFDVRNYLLDVVKMRKGNWLNAFVIGGYPLIGERERLIRTLGAREIFIEASKEECIERFKNLNLPKEHLKYINDWWDKYDMGGTPVRR